MAVFRTFTGFFSSDLGSNGSQLGPTFDVTGATPITLVIEDGPGDATVLGDVVNEVATDPDQIGYAFSGSTPIFSGEPVYLESVFTFTIGGQSFNGFQIETDPASNAGAASIVVLPPDLPPGVATVTSQ
ncbi:MAG: hypothetical protein AAGF90_22390, partial [Pseudomonadota bacterium]